MATNIGSTTTSTTGVYAGNLHIADSVALSFTQDYNAATTIKIPYTGTGITALTTGVTMTVTNKATGPATRSITTGYTPSAITESGTNYLQILVDAAVFNASDLNSGGTISLTVGFNYSATA